MSIYIYGRIQKNCIDDALLEKTIVEFFSPSGNVIKEYSEKCVTYKEIDDENKLIICFVRKKEPPYNIYDSNIINNEFEYSQLLIFDIRKEDISIDVYKEIISFCIYLKKKMKSKILITSDVHDDICLVDEKEIIWSNDLYFNRTDII